MGKTIVKEITGWYVWEEDGTSHELNVPALYEDRERLRGENKGLKERLQSQREAAIKCRAQFQEHSDKFTAENERLRAANEEYAKRTACKACQERAEAAVYRLKVNQEVEELKTQNESLVKRNQAQVDNVAHYHRVAESAASHIDILERENNDLKQKLHDGVVPTPDTLTRREQVFVAMFGAYAAADYNTWATSISQARIATGHCLSELDRMKKEEGK